MSVMHYRDLIAWQKAMDVVVDIYRSSDLFPKSECFGLTQQMRRAAVSIPSNIAEGQGRSTTKDYIHFLHIARGSIQELETQIYLATRLTFMTQEGQNELLAKTNEVSRLISGLIRSLSVNSS
jgi:four helix bundle protein